MPKDNVETRRDWEIVQENVGESKTERLRVLSGWLYRTTVFATTGAIGVAMVVVPAAIGE
jgi:hypothetical protein